jgi:hypothetical protein
MRRAVPNGPRDAVTVVVDDDEDEGIDEKEEGEEKETEEEEDGTTRRADVAYAALATSAPPDEDDDDDDFVVVVVAAMVRFFHPDGSPIIPVATTFAVVNVVAPPALTTVAPLPLPPPLPLPERARPSTMFVLRRNCIRVLTVSRGWHIDDSTKPAVPPASRCWRGDTFFPLSFPLPLPLPLPVVSSFVVVVVVPPPLPTSSTEEDDGFVIPPDDAMCVFLLLVSSSLFFFRPAPFLSICGGEGWREGGREDGILWGENATWMNIMIVDVCYILLSSLDLVFVKAKKTKREIWRERCQSSGVANDDASTILLLWQLTTVPSPLFFNLAGAIPPRKRAGTRYYFQ